MGRALGYLRPYRLAALIGLVSLLVVTAGTLLTPQFVRLLIDRGISGGSWDWTMFSAGGLLLVAIVRGFFNFLQGYLSERASQGVAFDLRNVIYGRIQTLSFSYHDTVQTGQLMTRMTSDVENVRNFVGQGFLTFVAATLTLLGTAVVLFATNWALALVSLAVVPVIFAILGFFVTRVVPRFRLIQAKLGVLNTVLQENLAGVAVVKAFAREPYEHGRYDAANKDLLAESLQVIKGLAASFPAVFLVANLGTLAVVWAGGTQVIGGSLTLGNLVAFNAYLAFLLLPVMQLGFIAATVSRAGVSAKRLFEVIDTESEVHDRPGAAALDHVVGEVTFDHVSFRYAGEATPVLADVSFTARPGETIAILGTTGAGKSTVLNLIPRFYDVTAGAVLVDGHDVRDVLLSSLRSHVGTVLQESLLFGGTVRDNIAYGRPDASLEEVVAAAQAAQAHDFIAALPDGYDTVVGERGVTLSGGQRQRVSIARTLLLDPKILLLDDATSSVDAETEHRLQVALRELMKGRTSFIIAQRLSTVRLADRVLVIDQGALADEGTHEELAESSGLYADIVASQLAPDTDVVGREVA